MAEALTLARKAGVDAGKVREALGGGFADSRILEVHGQRMVDDSFPLGAKCTTQRKDMDQALTLAAQLGCEMPATALNRAEAGGLIAELRGGVPEFVLQFIFKRGENFAENPSFLFVAAAGGAGGCSACIRFCLVIVIGSGGVFLV